MWIEQLQSVVNFQKQGNDVVRAVFFVGNQQMFANRVETPAVGSGSGSGS
jgi:hypothetical protein